MSSPDLDGDLGIAVVRQPTCSSRPSRLSYAGPGDSAAMSFDQVNATAARRRLASIGHRTSGGAGRAAEVNADRIASR
jgi:hypothetical protein